MGKTKIVAALAVIALALFSARVAQAMPPLPSSFYGEIHVIDNPPSAGDTVDAYVPGIVARAAYATILEDDGDLIYGIEVPGDDTSTSEVMEGGIEGETVTFKIGSRIVATGVWHTGTNVELKFHPPEALPGGPYSGNEGANIAFSGSANDWNSDASEYRWDWNNNGIYDSIGQSVNHAFADNGTYTVGMKVTDSQGGEGEDTVSVSVANVAPTATFSASSSVNEGSSSTVSFSGQTDPSSADTAAGFHYAFSCVNGDLSGATYAGSGTASSTTCPFSDNGTYTVKGRIIDKDGGYTEYTDSLTVLNVAPTATFSASSPIDEGDSSTVSFSAPSDPSSTDTSAGFHYAFSCTNGDLSGATYAGSGTTASTSCTFNDNGTYTVKGRIIDKDNGYTEYTAEVITDNTPPTATFDAASPINEGSSSTVAFTNPQDASIIDATEFHYAFSCVNGDLSGATYDGSGTASSTSCAFADNGTYTVKGRIIDKDDGYTEYTDTVTVYNVAPTASAGGPYTGNEGVAITFSGTASDVPADPLTYEWDFVYSGTFVADTSGSLTPSYAYPDNGAYTVALRVNDGDGGISIVTAVVNVSNVLPTASAGGPYTGNEGVAIAFSGTASDVAADPLTYEWDFNYDNVTFTVDASGSLAPSHTYPDNGSYTVALRVNDGDGGIRIVTAVVTVNNVVPTASAGGPYTGNEGVAINFAGTASDVAADVLSYEWDFVYDNVTFTVDASGSLTPSHIYPDNGTFTVALRVNDGDGGIRIVTAVVTVNNVLPTASAGGPYTGNEGVVINFVGSASDVAADPLTYAWDFDYSGTFAADISGTLTPSYTYPDNNVYTVALRVNDDDGGIRIVTASVTVNDVPPSAVSAGGPYSAVAGVPVTMTGSFTCAPVDTCTVYAWDLDNDGSYDDAAVNPATKTWNTIGTYTIGFRVTDSDGSSTAASTTVTISGATHSISLVVGWNLVSFRLHPQSTAIADVLADIAGHYDLVYAWDASVASDNWLKYDNVPESPDTLTNLTRVMGFWIHMTAADTLDVIGSIPSSTSIALYDNAGGWNLAGYPAALERTLPDALSNNGVTNYSLVVSYRPASVSDPWKIFDPLAPSYVNDLTSMTAGWGYWIKVTGDPTWGVVYQ